MREGPGAAPSAQPWRIWLPGAARLGGELGLHHAALLLDERRRHDERVRVVQLVDDLLRERGMRSALLVSSPLHLLRARLAFEKAGVDVTAVQDSPVDVWEISGAVDRLSLFEQAVHEYVGLAVYRLRGWI